MNKRKLPFNIRKSGSKYLFHGRIPTDLLNHPFFGDHKGFYSKSLGTDNLREATRRRDEILTTFDTLREGGQEEKFDLWTKKYREETEQFIKKHPHFEDPNEFMRIPFYSAGCYDFVRHPIPQQSGTLLNLVRVPNRL